MPETCDAWQWLVSGNAFLDVGPYGDSNWDGLFIEFSALRSTVEVPCELREVLNADASPGGRLGHRAFPDEEAEWPRLVSLDG